MKYTPVFVVPSNYPIQSLCSRSGVCHCWKHHWNCLFV